MGLLFNSLNLTNAYKYFNSYLMKKLILVFALAIALPLKGFAIGGLAGFYAGEFGNIGSGGGGYVTNSQLSPVITNRYDNYPIYTRNRSRNVNRAFTGGYSGFITSQNQIHGQQRGVGGLSEYYQTNPPNRFEQDGVGGLTQYYESNPPVMTPSEPQQNGFTEHFETGLAAGNFDRQCRPKPRPTTATCNGGTFRALKNNYGCTVDWKCEGGNFCPLPRPPARQCNGELEPQYNGRGCLTHYFCDRTPDIPDPTPECIGSIYECSTAYRNPWLRAWGQ